jgi:DNA-binding CsgD family transcriptional regulator
MTLATESTGYCVEQTNFADYVVLDKAHRDSRSGLLVQGAPGLGDRPSHQAARYAARGVAGDRDQMIASMTPIRHLMLWTEHSGELNRPDANFVLFEGVDLAQDRDLLHRVLEDLSRLAGVIMGALTGTPGASIQQIGHATERSLASDAYARASTRALPDPLRPQELKVLRYLGSRLTQREIAAELYISINTMKTHVKAIYRKLDVGTRRDAVERGRQFGLT